MRCTQPPNVCEGTKRISCAPHERLFTSARILVSCATLFLFFTALYGITALILALRGIQLVPPWFLLVGVALFTAPLGYLLKFVGDEIERAIGKRPIALPLLAVGVGLALTGVYHRVLENFLAVLLVFLVVAGFTWRWGRGGYVRPLLYSLPLILMGYGAVWALNYLVASLTFDTVRDAALWQVDLAIYQWLAGAADDGSGVFPLVRHAVPFALLENAYHFMFAGLLLTIFVLHSTGGDVRLFLRSLFTCYLAACALFMLYPVVGPSLSFPALFDAAFAHTQTYDIMLRTHTEYNALRNGKALTGFGYFVAAPSLHVAMAVVVQAFLYRSPPHFWLFLPVNALVLPATVLLGYHYIIDVPAGIALAAAVLYAPVAHRAIHSRLASYVGDGSGMVALPALVHRIALRRSLGS